MNPPIDFKSKKTYENSTIKIRIKKLNHWFEGLPFLIKYHFYLILLYKLFIVLHQYPHPFQLLLHTLFLYLHQSFLSIFSSNKYYKKCGNGNKFGNYLKINLKRMGNGESMGIEDNDDALACKSIDAKLEGSGNNNIFF